MTTLAKMKRTLEEKMKAVYGHRINELGSKLAAYQETNESLTSRLAAAEVEIERLRGVFSRMHKALAGKVYDPTMMDTFAKEAKAEAAKGEGEMSECEKSPLGRHVASFSGRCKYCGWIPPAPPSYEEMQQRLAAAEEDNASLRNHLEAERGNYWAWQGDGEDHLESLSCPVVIQPQKLLEITARLAAAGALLREDLAGIGHTADWWKRLNKALEGKP